MFRRTCDILLRVGGHGTTGRFRDYEGMGVRQERAIACVTQLLAESGLPWSQSLSLPAAATTKTLDELAASPAAHRW